MENCDTPNIHLTAVSLLSDIHCFCACMSSGKESNLRSDLDEKMLTTTRICSTGDHPLFQVGQFKSFWHTHRTGIWDWVWGDNRLWDENQRCGCYRCKRKVVQLECTIRQKWVLRRGIPKFHWIYPRGSRLFFCCTVTMRRVILVPHSLIGCPW